MIKLDARAIYFSIQSVLFAPLMIGISFAGLESVDDYIYVYVGPQIGGLLILVLLLAVLSSVVFAAEFIFTKQFSKGISALLVLVVLYICWIGPFDRNFFEHHKTDRFRSRDHTECLASAIEWSPGKKLAMCEKTEHGVSGYTDAYFYDSSDEITKINSERSLVWRSVAKKFLPDFGGDGEFMTVISLGNHFYLVKIDVSAMEAAHFF